MSEAMNEYLARVEKVRNDMLRHVLLEHTASAAEMWNELNAHGLSDREVMKAFNDNLGKRYSGGGWHGQGMYQCRPNRFEYDAAGSRGGAVEGTRLVALIREVLDIRRPEEVMKPTLF